MTTNNTNINMILIFSTILTINAEAKNLIENNMKIANGKFEVELIPQEDSQAPVGRFLINKKYTGDLIGKGIGQMISKRTESGASVYSAIEEFKGSLQHKKGSFTLFHNGYMSKNHQTLKIIIVEGSGTLELQGLSGTLIIKQEKGVHKYQLEYTLQE